MVLDNIGDVFMGIFSMGLNMLRYLRFVLFIIRVFFKEVVWCCDVFWWLGLEEGFVGGGGGLS